MNTIIACNKCMAVPHYDDSNIGAGCACGGTFTYAQVVTPRTGSVAGVNTVQAIFADGVQGFVSLTSEQYQDAKTRSPKMERISTYHLRGAALAYACSKPDTDQPKTFGCNHNAPTCPACETSVQRWLVTELGGFVEVPVGLNDLPWEQAFPAPAKPVPADLGLTNKEKAILQKTAELYNLLAVLPDKHPSDMDENRRDIHNIQNRVMARVAARANPELVR